MDSPLPPTVNQPWYQQQQQRKRQQHRYPATARRRPPRAEYNATTSSYVATTVAIDIQFFGMKAMTPDSLWLRWTRVLSISISAAATAALVEDVPRWDWTGGARVLKVTPACRTADTHIRCVVRDEPSRSRAHQFDRFATLRGSQDNRSSHFTTAFMKPPPPRPHPDH